MSIPRPERAASSSRTPTRSPAPSPRCATISSSACGRSSRRRSPTTTARTGRSSCCTSISRPCRRPSCTRSGICSANIRAGSPPRPRPPTRTRSRRSIRSRCSSSPKTPTSRRRSSYDAGSGRRQAAPVRLGAHESHSRTAEGGARAPAGHAAPGAAAPARVRPTTGAGGTTPGTPWRKAASARRAIGPPADDRRLRALVDHAHKLGYWIRFYTLDGFAPAESKGLGPELQLRQPRRRRAALESRDRRRREPDRDRPVRGLTHSHARIERTKIASGCASEALVSGQGIVSFLSGSVLLCPDRRPRPERQCHR